MSLPCFSLATDWLCSTKATKSMPQFCTTRLPGCLLNICGSLQSSFTPVLLSFFLLSALKHKYSPGFSWALLSRRASLSAQVDGLIVILPSVHFLACHLHGLPHYNQEDAKILSTETKLVHNLHITAVQSPVVYSSSTVWWKYKLGAGVYRAQCV